MAAAPGPSATWPGLARLEPPPRGEGACAQALPACLTHVRSNPVVCPPARCSKVVEAGEIDDINILQAALKAMEGAAAALAAAPDFLLVDGNRLPKVGCQLPPFPISPSIHVYQRRRLWFCEHA
jgi:hypothetical protein